MLIGLSQIWTGPKPQQLLEAIEYKGDLLIRYFCYNGSDSVHDVNTDANSYSLKAQEKCLQKTEREKKKMYLEACLQQCRHFSPFVASVDGLLGVKATITVKRIASRLTTKWRQTYSRTCRYVKSRFAITFLRATHRCIRGSMVPVHEISVQHPQWEDGAGLNVFR